MKLNCILLLFVSLLVSCVPLSSVTNTISIVAESNNKIIEKHIVHNNFMAIASSEGFFVDGYIREVEYWMRTGDKKKELKHLSSLDPGYTLEDFFSIGNSNNWVAFELEEAEITKEKVGINIVVFNERKILHKKKIKDCKRLDVCADHFRNIQSYAIKLNQDSTRLIIETLNGKLEYDLINSTSH